MPKINFIHPPEFKAQTRDKKTEPIPLSSRVILSLSQHTGAPSEPIVKPGDTVKTGQLIAGRKGFISANIHASLSGKVVSIKEMPHPALGSYKAIVIESDGKDEKAYSPSPPDLSAVSGPEIVRIVESSGIVGLGGAAFPSHVKLNPPPDKKIDTLIINGAECEPFLTCDFRLMLERPRELIQGVSLIAKALGLKKVIIAIEDNKIEAIERLGSTIFRLGQKEIDIRVMKLRTRYPQGGEKQLIKMLLGREVPSGGLPLDVGCVVNNVQTAFSIYEAVYRNKPLYERVITVAGAFLKKRGNFLVRVGTPMRHILDFCGVDLESDIFKVITGGPMTGIAQFTLDAPVVKGTSGIIVFSRAVQYKEDSSCIRCSRCIDACPMGLMPCMIGSAVKHERFDLAADYNPFDCIECGSCSYVCPSRIELTQFIKIAKAALKKANRR